MNAATDRIARKFVGAVEDEWELYSDNSADYTIGKPIGFGASSTVYAAQYYPPGAPQPLPVALKVLDLDRLAPSALRLLQRETQLMSLSKHPNVLRVRGTWMDGHKLYIAMRLMNAGSVVDVMHYAWPGGMEEEVVRCILKQALEGLHYLHTNGLIHRDIKPANLLIDDDGTVLLGDLGVAAFLHDAEDSPPPPTSPTVHIHKRSTASARYPHAHAHAHAHSHHHHSHQTHHSSEPAPPPALSKRKSFVGTPCYMAPEVIDGRTYDASADIWSFGITALALTQGRAPRSLLAPQTALLQTVRDAPPTLDRGGGAHAYSRALQDAVAACLEKAPAKRPSAAALLAMPLFRGAKKKGFLVGAILQGLPPLAERLERRRLPSVMTRGSTDSWDFESAAASPAASVYGRRMPGALSPSVSCDHDESEGREDGGSDADEGAGAQKKGRESRRTSAEMYSVRARGRHGGSHSRGVSWDDALRNPSRDLSTGAADHAHPAPIAEVELPIATEAPSDSEPSSEPDALEDEDEETPLKATLAIPTPPELSSSPSGSSYSSSSASASMALSAAPAAAPARLWKKLTGKLDGEKPARAATEALEKERERRSSVSGKGDKEPSIGVGIVRRKTLAMFGRTASTNSVAPAGGGAEVR